MTSVKRSAARRVWALVFGPRLLLLPLIVLALLAPSSECPSRPVIFKADGSFLVPPLPVGTPGAFWGTDVDGRDLGCLNARGTQRTLVLVGVVFVLGVLPGVLMGLWLGRRGHALAFPGEVLLLIGLVLFFGPNSYRLVLTAGFALYVARVVAGRVQAVYQESFLEGARAIGGSEGGILTRHVLPHVTPDLPGLLATALSVVFLWVAELGMLGFYDRGGYVLEVGTPETGRSSTLFVPSDPDLGQVVSFKRWAWLDHPAHLIVPVLLLVALNVALSDLGRAASHRARQRS